MPELPEVETVVRALRPKLEDRRLDDVVHASPLMIRDERFASLVAGRRVLRIDRRGKWIFVRLDDASTLVLHLGMSGKLSVVACDLPVESHTHVRVRLSDRGAERNQELRFVDPRRFGEAYLATEAMMEERFGDGKLGPEPTQLTPKEMQEILAGSRRAIKALLLDQSAIAGIGNIYADEILHVAGVHPARMANSIDARTAGRLCTAARKVLAAAIANRGSSIRSYVDAEGMPGDNQSKLRVYGRADEGCRRCRAIILLDRTIVRGRATHWCPTCQPE